MEQLLVPLYAVFLAPTKYNFIRQTYMPSFISPSLFLCFTILLGVFVKVLFIGGRLPVIPKRLWIPYVSMLVLMMLSLFYTPNFEYGLKKVFEFMFTTTVACFIPFFLFRNLLIISRFLGTILLIGIVFVVVILIANPYSTSFEFKTKIGSNYLLIQHMSGMAGLIILYYYVMRAKSVRYTIWLFSLFVTIMGVILYVGGKGPVLAFVVTTFFMSIKSVKVTKRISLLLHSKRQLLFPILVIVTGSAVLTFFMFTQDFSALIWRIGFIFSGEHYSQVERLENARIALTLFQQNPFFGVGIGGFSAHSFVLEGVERFRYPHNIIIEVLSELGLVGFLLFSFIITFSFRHLLSIQKKYLNSHFPTVFIALFLFTFLNAMTSQDITNPALFSFIGISFALKIAVNNEELEKNSRSNFSI